MRFQVASPLWLRESSITAGLTQIASCRKPTLDPRRQCPILKPKSHMREHGYLMPAFISIARLQTEWTCEAWASISLHTPFPCICTQMQMMQMSRGQQKTQVPLKQAAAVTSLAPRTETFRFIPSLQTTVKDPALGPTQGTWGDEAPPPHTHTPAALRNNVVSTARCCLPQPSDPGSIAHSQRGPCNFLRV